MIFNIQRDSTHDGPGIRTLVFIKGCSLGCRWCQNPESRAPTRDLLYDTLLCLKGCDRCQQAVPAVITRALNGLILYRQGLTDKHLTALAHCCPTQESSVCGEVRAMEEIIPCCAITSLYQRSGGGITCSGSQSKSSRLAISANFGSH